MQGYTEPTRYQTTILHKSGSPIQVELNVGIIEHDGRPAVLIFVHDISKQLEAEQRLREYARQQKLLNDITRSAIETNNLDDTLDILANRLGELIHADSCYITLWDEATQTTISAAASGHLRERYRQIQFSPQETTITKIVLESGQPLIIPDMQKSPYCKPSRAMEFSTRSMLAIPLIAGNRKLGAALIAFNELHSFSQDEVELGQQVSRQIGLAILKAQLLETAQRRATEAETLRQAGVVVAATLKLDEAIDRILQQLNRVVPYDSASVQLLQDDKLVIVGQHGFANPDDVLGKHFSITGDNPNSIVIKTRQPYVLGDAPRAYPQFESQAYHIHGWMGIPLIVQERIIGMLPLDSHQPNRFTHEHVRLASAFAAQVAIAIENARLYEETHRLAITDPLIGIFNRRHFMDLARREHQRARRYNRPLSIIMMDLDHFSGVNDTYGHLIGDQVLRAVALICQDQLRETDIIGRYGGEEFVILLPETPDENVTTDPVSHPSIKVAERLRKAIENTPIKTNRGDIHITASLGVVELSPEGEGIETLLDRADQALYAAKQAGRNKVVAWRPDLTIPMNTC